MIRTILVTVVKNRTTGETSEIYGRYDAVTLERNNLIPVDSFKRKYKMTDDTFAHYGEAIIENE